MSESSKPARSCGGCTACCKVFSISELAKPEGVWCKHCNVGSGCKIYARRPKECKDFRCMWLLGHGTEQERPDKTRLVLDFIRDVEHGPFVALRVTELTLGTLQSPVAKREMARALSQGYFVYRVTALGKESILVRKGEPIPPVAKALIDLGIEAFEAPVMVR